MRRHGTGLGRANGDRITHLQIHRQQFLNSGYILLTNHRDCRARHREMSSPGGQSTNQSGSTQQGGAALGTRRYMDKQREMSSPGGHSIQQGGAALGEYVQSLHGMGKTQILTGGHRYRGFAEVVFDEVFLGIHGQFEHCSLIVPLVVDSDTDLILSKARKYIGLVRSLLILFELEAYRLLQIAIFLDGIGEEIDTFLFLSQGMRVDAKGGLAVNNRHLHGLEKQNSHTKQSQ